MEILDFLPCNEHPQRVVSYYGEVRNVDLWHFQSPGGGGGVVGTSSTMSLRRSLGSRDSIVSTGVEIPFYLHHEMKPRLSLGLPAIRN